MADHTRAGAAGVDDRLVRRLHRDAGAARWGLTVERFGEALTASAARRFHPAPLASVPRREVAAYLASLHVADLALAQACADGCAQAWDVFMATERPRVYAAAHAIAGARGRELADTLWADLYGTEVRDGRRRALLDYFHGRSRLSTWLRSVLAQRHVDQARADRRTRSLDETGEHGSGAHGRPEPAAPDPPPEPDRPRLMALFGDAVAAAVAALAPADRLSLSYYYLHGLTLAEIGRLTRVHESSVSRRLDRARRALRADIERRLAGHGLGKDDVRQCYEWEAAGGTSNLVNLADPVDPANPADPSAQVPPRGPFKD